jgi:hypothetical protein
LLGEASELSITTNLPLVHRAVIAAFLDLVDLTARIRPLPGPLLPVLRRVPIALRVRNRVLAKLVGMVAVRGYARAPSNGWAAKMAAGSCRKRSHSARASATRLG